MAKYFKIGAHLMLLHIIMTSVCGTTPTDISSDYWCHVMHSKLRQHPIGVAFNGYVDQDQSRQMAFAFHVPQYTKGFAEFHVKCQYISDQTPDNFVQILPVSRQYTDGSLEKNGGPFINEDGNGNSKNVKCAVYTHRLCHTLVHLAYGGTDLGSRFRGKAGVEPSETPSTVSKTALTHHSADPSLPSKEEPVKMAKEGEKIAKDHGWFEDGKLKQSLMTKEALKKLSKEERYKVNQFVLREGGDALPAILAHSVNYGDFDDDNVDKGYLGALINLALKAKAKNSD